MENFGLHKNFNKVEKIANTCIKWKPKLLKLKNNLISNFLHTLMKYHFVSYKM